MRCFHMLSPALNLEEEVTTPAFAIEGPGTYRG